MTTVKKSGEHAMAALFSALADPTRLRLLNLMREREVCVCYFVEILGQSQPKISRHLAYLRRQGLVRARRDGKWMHYALADADPESAALLTAALAALKNDARMRADSARLQKACCEPAKLVAIKGAPTPVRVRSHINRR